MPAKRSIRVYPSPAERRDERDYTMPIMSDVNFQNWITVSGREGTSTARLGVGWRRRWWRWWLRRRPYVDRKLGRNRSRPALASSSPRLLPSFNSRSPFQERNAITIPARFVPVSQTSFSQRAARSLLLLLLRSSPRRAAQPPIPGVFLYGLSTIISHCPAKSPGDRITSS